MKRECVDCSAKLEKHGDSIRCRSCAARFRYIEKHGKPAEIKVFKCDVCKLEFRDYASNRKKNKLGTFCSQACRAAYVGIHNSVSRGGDGQARTKADKDRLNYLKNAERIREQVKKRYQEKRVEILAALRLKTLALKTEVIMAYGGRCVCCDESILEFLTIDHVNNDGAAHRKKCGKGRGIYKDIKARGFPKGDYRVLCFNCNIARGFYGYCPHHPEDNKGTNHVAHNPGRPRSTK